MGNIGKNKQLLVEGNDDFHVMLALCKQYQIPETFEIIDSKGIDKLLDSIPVYLKKSGIDTIGIIIDADADINSRWQTLKDILSKAGYNLPSAIFTKGLIHKEVGKITIGIWLMPDNNINGMIEDFIKFLIPANDKLMPIAEIVLNDLEMRKLNKYQPIHRSKALIHTWLSWQENPGTPMGLSITKKYLTSSVPQCDTFVEWIKELFK